MSATTKERYARRKRSEANKISQRRAAAWSDTDDGQMSDDQRDGRPSDTDSQASGPASVASNEQMEDQPDYSNGSFIGYHASLEAVQPHA